MHKGRTGLRFGRKLNSGAPRAVDWSKLFGYHRTWGTTRGTVGVRLGYGWGTGGVRPPADFPEWGTVGVQVGYAGKFSVNRL